MPIPGLNGCSSPVGERWPSGNQTKFFWLLSTTAPKAIARKDRPVGVDWHRLREPADQASERIAEGCPHPARPVSMAQSTVVERRGDCERIEEANVVGC